MFHCFDKEFLQNCDTNVLPLQHNNISHLFNNPMVCTAPNALCQEAVKQTKALIEGYRHLWKDDINKGKMFGVLVVKNNNTSELGFLCAFSGQIKGQAQWQGFVDMPLDYTNENGYFKAQEHAISNINEAISTIEKSPQKEKINSCYEAQLKTLQTKINDFELKAKQAKQRRHYIKENNNLTASQLENLLNESRFMKAELKRMKKQFAELQNQHIKAIEGLNNEIKALKQQRKQQSDNLQKWLFDNFYLYNFEHQSKNITSIFKDYNNSVPPSGAGECCAPKLLHYAFKHHYTIVNIAEFWIGQSPKSVIRKNGFYYGACKHKCQPILHFMLPQNVFKPIEMPHYTHASLKFIYEDSHIAVVCKPPFMPSVRGKHRLVSVEDIVKAKYCNSNSPLIVHRLDMDTSGLMVIAKTKEAYSYLQQQFENHCIKKRYIAVLSKAIESNKTKGVVELPLMPNVEERPMQMVNKQFGKTAITSYRVVNHNVAQQVFGYNFEKQKANTTVVALYPHTGRTHQLRVHCAHFEGLNAPIVGDRLYGQPHKRLFLHAQAIAFKHPKTKKWVVFKS